MDRADRDKSSGGSDFTHHHFPDYLARPPVGPGRVSSIRDFVADPDLTQPSFFYLGMRCYAEFRTVDTPPPHGEALQPACARMRERFVLEPVVETLVPNRGDVWLEYYGDAPELRMGLYRIRAR
jgi:CRISPR/Cas system endoribonuclease Cas6 (RAMP superfamily)